ncbi:MAG: tRNA (adenosine(37)-N6)-threonylcarbamoyltransferase complex ATPase subunit type 1 TsaE [Rhodocyclaceae bacterium]|nr:tRNA (adenosine(37)-N6)-threonylcarbamoyltransferase complex ATPase subunit type 1 TsaE [Rhodocyclaceae bacterium]
MPVSHSTDDNALACVLADVEATVALGAALASVLPPQPAPPAVIYLEGDLGAGKTTLVTGLLRKINASEPVKSPTYTLLEVHVISGLHFYHLDFYRFSKPEEFLDAGLDDCFSGAGVCLVEWPEKARPYLPGADLVVRLAYEGGGRRARIEAVSERGWTWLSALKARLDALGWRDCSA